MIIFYYGIGLSIFSYLFFTYTQYSLGKKAGVDDNWMAFIPILNMVHFFKIAGMSFLKYLICFGLSLAPMVIGSLMDKATPMSFILIALGMIILIFSAIYYIFALPINIAKNADCSPISGLLLLFPFINLYTLSFFAFKEEKKHVKLLVAWALLTLFFLSPKLLMQYTGEKLLQTDAVSSQEFLEKIQTFSSEHAPYILKNLKKLGFNVSKESYNEEDHDELMTKNESFYIWKDLEGNENYVSSLDDIPEQFRAQARKLNSKEMKEGLSIMTPEEEGAVLTQTQGMPVPEQLKHGEFIIKIYTYMGDKYLNETRSYFDKFHLKYNILYVEKDPTYATELKQKLGLDINKKYNNINYPVVEIDGQIIKRIVETKDEDGNVSITSLDTAAINKIFGLRSTFE